MTKTLAFFVFSVWLVYMALPGSSYVNGHKHTLKDYNWRGPHVWLAVALGFSTPVLALVVIL